MQVRVQLGLACGEQLDVVGYYDRYFREGMVDLSASSAPPIAVRLPESFEVEHSSPRQAVALREAIAARYASLTAEDVLVTAGASEALVALANALLSRGERVCMARGAYPSFAAAAVRNGASATSDETVPAGADVFLITNPSVPDGIAMDIGPAIDSAKRAGAVLVADEVYRELAHHRPIRAAADCDGGAVSVGDLSKPLGLGGLRIGWIASRNQRVMELAYRELQLLSAGPSTLSAAVALGALQGMDEQLARVRRRIADAAPGVYSLLERAGWAYVRAQAGVTIAARPPRRMNEEDFEGLRRAGLFLLPGDTLGAPGCVRLNLLAPFDDIERALSITMGDTV